MALTAQGSYVVCRQNNLASCNFLFSGNLKWVLFPFKHQYKKNKMGKAEVGTPKWIGNKMKSKGLQKLRWYCQMCQKQCRDENGFKCHTRY